MPDLALHMTGVSRVDQADHLVDFLEHALRVGGRKIDLVDRRKDFEVVVERHEDVGERLRLDALGGIDDENRAFAGGQRARDFVSEVDVAGSIDQVEDVLLSVFGRVVEPNALALIVIPRSRSISMLSRYWASISRAVTVPVRSRRRSAKVDLPWSMCAMMQKFRIFLDMKFHAN